MPLLVIPYKDANGLIQACQIRLHANDISFNEKRYCWLSSPLERLRLGDTRSPDEWSINEANLERKAANKELLVLLDSASVCRLFLPMARIFTRTASAEGRHERKFFAFSTVAAF